MLINCEFLSERINLTLFRKESIFWILWRSFKHLVKADFHVFVVFFTHLCILLGFFAFEKLLFKSLAFSQTCFFSIVLDYVAAKTCFLNLFGFPAYNIDNIFPVCFFFFFSLECLALFGIFLLFWVLFILSWLTYELPNQFSLVYFGHKVSHKFKKQLKHDNENLKSIGSNRVNVTQLLSKNTTISPFHKGPLTVRSSAPSSQIFSFSFYTFIKVSVFSSPIKMKYLLVPQVLMSPNQAAKTTKSGHTCLIKKNTVLG